MRKFEISTDSTSDFYLKEYEDMQVDFEPLDFILSKDNEIIEQKDNFKTIRQYYDFYKKLKEGYIAKTSILNLQAHVNLFTRIAKRGVKHLIHISQGYGLSPTLDNANKAIEIVKKDFPEIDFIAMEANSTTVGEGLIVKCAVCMRDEGKTMEEAFKKLNEIKKYTQHFIIVNDLKFLARSGRISNASASIGSILQVKPIIEFDKHGKLKVCKKEMGFKKALKSVVDEYSNFTLNKEFPFISIVHTDNETQAINLKKLLKEKYNIEAEIKIMGPIIGAHVGPNTVAYCFISNEERVN